MLSVEEAAKCARWLQECILCIYDMAQRARILGLTVASILSTNIKVPGNRSQRRLQTCGGSNGFMVVGEKPEKFRCGCRETT